MIYLAHPYGGKLRNKIKAQRLLKKLYKNSICTTYVSPIHAFGYLYKHMSYDDGMYHCLALLKTCKSALFCKGWEKSKGCQMEMVYCRDKDIPFRVLDYSLLRRAK